MITLSKKNFDFYEIEKEYKENFVESQWNDLSDFHAEALTWIGDAIRGAKSQHFWSNGCYCWFTDETQSVEECVWMTQNGIAMYEKITEGKLYRISFNH